MEIRSEGVRKSWVHPHGFPPKHPKPESNAAAQLQRPTKPPKRSIAPPFFYLLLLHPPKKGLSLPSHVCSHSPHLRSSDVRPPRLRCGLAPGSPPGFARWDPPWLPSSAWHRCGSSTRWTGPEGGPGPEQIEEGGFGCLDRLWHPCGRGVVLMLGDEVCSTKCVRDLQRLETLREKNKTNKRKAGSMSKERIWSWSVNGR